MRNTVTVNETKNQVIVSPETKTVTVTQGSSSVVVSSSGTVGPQGDTGPQGPTGPTGATGTAATIAVGTTTTGSAGSNVSVVNSGSSSAATFDFTIPRGDTGAQGPQGIQGPQGPQGANGLLVNVEDDTTPSLGGNLDVNGKDIVSTSNGDIDLDPNGSGKVVFKGNSTKGSGQFVLNCEVNSHGVTIKGPPHSAGASYTLVLPNTTGSNGNFLKTDGAGNTFWGAVTGFATSDEATALALALG